MTTTFTFLPRGFSVPDDTGGGSPATNVTFLARGCSIPDDIAVVSDVFLGATYMQRNFNQVHTQRGS